jgi:hypothetical protein
MCVLTILNWVEYWCHTACLTPGSCIAVQVSPTNYKRVRDFDRKGGTLEPKNGLYTPHSRDVLLTDISSSDCFLLRPFTERLWQPLLPQSLLRLPRLGLGNVSQRFLGVASRFMGASQRFMSVS